jgi:Glycosyl transferase family 2
MRFLKRSTRKKPVLSLILLDWNVRESFHLLHYLARQSVDRDQFEVVFIEYYSRVAEPLKQFAEQVDTWVLMEMPESCIYHKHLMYNCGLAFARGDIIVLCDSDAMVKRSFIETIIRHFNENKRTVLHLDQFRNMRRDLYPFNYPSFEEVIGAGCFNHVEGKTSGIVDQVDPLHSRNYGACMCARRADLIEIGGADEHIDYLGHICGPYEMTLRLLNRGFEEVWHETEYLYHTWHPGQAGVDNYQGPHDGRQMSSTALEALITGRVYPLIENETMRLIRNDDMLSAVSIEKHLIDKRYLTAWDRSMIAAQQKNLRTNRSKPKTDIYRGFRIIEDHGIFYARPLLETGSTQLADDTINLTLESSSVEELVQKIDEVYPVVLRFSEQVNRLYSRVSLLTWAMAVPLIGIVKIFLVRVGESEHASERIANRVSGVPWLSRMRRFWEKYRVGWLANKHYRAFMDRWANHLIANLYFAEPGMHPPIVLTTSLYVQIYLKGLLIIRLLPPIEVRRLKNRAKIQHYFDHISGRDYPQTLIVARNIYTNYYGMIKACDLKQVLVL